MQLGSEFRLALLTLLTHLTSYPTLTTPSGLDVKLRDRQGAGEDEDEGELHGAEIAAMRSDAVQACRRVRVRLLWAAEERIALDGDSKEIMSILAGMGDERKSIKAGMAPRNQCAYIVCFVSVL